MTDPRGPERAYPLDGAIDIAAWTRLLYAVRDTLIEQGYPRPTAADLPELGVAIGTFLHGPAR